MPGPQIVWFRRDLRLTDQAAFAAACADGGPVIPVYVLDDETPASRTMGGASRWWLHHSLSSLDTALRGLGSRLVLRRGRADAVLAALARETGAARVHALRHYEPWWRDAEQALAKHVALCLHDGNYLAPPGSVTTGAGMPYRIYTPFWRALSGQMPPAAPRVAPAHATVPDGWPRSDDLAEWRLLPSRPDWSGGLHAQWEPGEEGAHRRLRAFAGKASSYGKRRDLPSDEGTSRLSPHLHFGEISPAGVWHATASAGGSVATFLGELAWRDYAQNVIVQFPDYGEISARDPFPVFPWREGPEAEADLEAWKRGETGYPVVDAGMRQLWHTGWMHNRVRMIAASFLVKHLLIDWRVGERWFWDTLVDADYASNAINWQWVAGSGVDANMFVRIMAPLSQSAKFDAAAYIRAWVPELAHLPDDAIHDPPGAVRGCPAKRIDHRDARERALAAWAQAKRRVVD